MALFDKILGEFIDIIEWTDTSSDTLVWKFPRYQDEIKNGAKLTVRPGQVALFVNEGKIADVFEPGMHTLATSNLPILSTLRGWKHGFDSPFKADVFFVATRQFPDIKWGTKNPIMLRDADFGILRLRAFGSCILQVENPRILVEQVAGTNPNYTIDSIREVIRNTIVARFSDMMGSSGIPALDMASRYDELGSQLATICAPEFQKMGFRLPQLLVENISLPEDVEKAIDKRASMGAVGNLDQFTKFQAATAMEAAASNPGTAGAGMGMGVGMMFAQQMAGQANSTPSQANPPPLPQTSKEWWVSIDNQQNGPHDLTTLLALFGQGRIDTESLVWKQGMPSWTSLSALPEITRFIPPK